MTTENYKYAKLCDHTIFVRNSSKYSISGGISLENVKLVFDDNILTITGNALKQSDICMDGKVFLEDLTGNLKHHKQCKYDGFAYKKFKDIFKRRKRPYFEYSYVLNETTPYECKMNTWKIIK